MSIASEPSRMTGRSTLLGCVAFVATLNGLLDPLRDAYDAFGLLPGLLATFGISAIVWVGLARAVQLVARDRGVDPMERQDWWAVAAAAILILLPVESPSWAAASAILAYGWLTARPGDRWSKAGFAVGLACTASLFWSPMLFSVLSQWILAFDATMVGAITGTGHTGNTVPLADGSGELWIAPKCSSFASLSLVPVCWLTLSAGRTITARRTIAALAWACFGVILVNVTRIGLIGLYPGWYEEIHGDVGSMVASWLTMSVIFAACYRGAYGAQMDGDAPRRGTSRVVADAETDRGPIAAYR